MAAAVLLGVTGGIAAYKAALLARLLVHDGADVQVLMTPSATRFVGPDTFAALTATRCTPTLFERPDTSCTSAWRTRPTWRSSPPPRRTSSRGWRSGSPTTW